MDILGGIITRQTHLNETGKGYLQRGIKRVLKDSNNPNGYVITQLQTNMDLLNAQRELNNAQTQQTLNELVENERQQRKEYERMMLANNMLDAQSYARANIEIENMVKQDLDTITSNNMIQAANITAQEDANIKQQVQAARSGIVAEIADENVKSGVAKKDVGKIANRVISGALEGALIGLGFGGIASGISKGIARKVNTTATTKIANANANALQTGTNLLEETTKANPLSKATTINKVEKSASLLKAEKTATSTQKFMSGARWLKGKSVVEGAGMWRKIGAGFGKSFGFWSALGGAIIGGTLAGLKSTPYTLDKKGLDAINNNENYSDIFELGDIDSDDIKSYYDEYDY